MSNLAIDLQGEYAFYDQSTLWQEELRRREVPSSWILGQRIYANHSRGLFRTSIVESAVVAGSTIRLKVEGITPYAPLVIISGRLNEEPLEPFGKTIIPYEEALDAIVQIPPDIEGGTYVFFAQQWELGGSPAYPGGSLIYPSSVSSLEVQPRLDEEAFWQSFEPWSKEDADEVRENIKRSKERLQS